jgi:protein kinase A
MSMMRPLSSKSVKISPTNMVTERHRQDSFKEYDNILEELRIVFETRWKQSVKANQVGNLEDFDIQRTLGTGAFGRVLLVKHKNDHNYYAMKIMSKSKIVNKKQVEKL